MNQIGVSTAIFSITAPGVVILGDGSEASARLARQINEEVAQMRDLKPKTFGFFATLPSLMNPDAAIKEIRYALDELHADGVCLCTRYGQGHNYLGHERFRPVWAELNSRRAVVFIHPTHSVDTGLVNPTSPQPIFDYPHETLRTAMDMILCNTKRDFPDCKVIHSHAGGTLSFLVGRVSGIYEYMFPGTVNKAQIEEDAKSFYFDLALSTSPDTLYLLLKWAPHDCILFGSDFPYAPSQGIVNFGKSFDTYPMEEELRAKLCYENAWKLFPRLAPK